MIRTLSVLTLLLLTAACSVHHVDTTRPLPTAIPDAFSQSGQNAPPDRWWHSLEDDELNQLIDEALTGNLNLEAAWARLEQANAAVQISAAYQTPEVSLGSEAQRGRTRVEGLGDPSSKTVNRFVLTTPLSYELDLFRRLGSLNDAADFEAAASRETLEALAVVLTAQIAETWYRIQEDREQLRLLAEQRQASLTFLELVELRFGQGLSSAVEVYQQRVQLASTESLIPVAAQQLQLEENRLAVLLGRAPGPQVFGAPAGAASKDPPRIFGANLSPLPALGIPAETLLRRPDVRASQARVVAADFRVESAIANRFPTLRLSAAEGFQSSSASELFSGWIWSIAGGLTAPLIDGGRRRGEVDKSQAALREALALYESNVLQALQETEDALAKEQQQRLLLESLMKQASHARAAFNESRQRYAVGITEYLPVLTALQAQQQAERLLLAVKRDLLLSRIALYRSLGASWTVELRDQSTDTQDAEPKPVEKT